GVAQIAVFVCMKLPKFGQLRRQISLGRWAIYNSRFFIICTGLYDAVVADYTALEDRIGGDSCIWPNNCVFELDTGSDHTVVSDNHVADYFDAGAELAIFTQLECTVNIQLTIESRFIV